MRGNRDSKVFRNFIVSILVIALTFGNWAVLGQWVVSKATSSTLDVQEDETKVKNVKFNIGIWNGEDSQYSYTSDINDMVKLKSYISVENEGYLKDAYISFGAENGEDKNFNIVNINQDEDIVKNSSDNEIALKQITENKTINLEFDLKYNITNIETDLNKNNIAKLTAVYVDNNGKENKIEKSIMFNLNWICQNDVMLETEISKYTEYNLPEENGVIITQNLKLTQNKEEKLPFKNIEITAKQLQIDEKSADKIIITNQNRKIDYEILGNNQIKFTEENAKTQEEYKITYIFKDEKLKENLKIETNANVKANIYGENEEKQADCELISTIDAKNGDIVQLNTDKIEEISKGKMYANHNQKIPEYETTYNTNLEIEIAYAENLKGIKVQDTATYFENAENKQYEMQDSIESYVIYKRTSINKADFDTILGEEGWIKIFDKDNNQIAEINKETSLDESDNYNIVYENETSNITIKTSKIINEGTLAIHNKKAIKSQLLYTKEQVKTFQNLVDIFNLSLIDTEESETEVNSYTINTKLNETSTKSKLSLSSNKLSSISKNENVELKIELNNNSENSDLYQNPKFEIELPKEISDIEIKDANILFDEELQIENISKSVKNGRITISIKLKGTQSKFLLEEYTNGTTIILNTNITVDMRTASKTDAIIMTYNNENAIKYNEENYGQAKTDIEFVSPVGMIIGTEIANYNANEEKIISVSQGSKTGKLEIYTEKKQAQVNLLVMNNTGNDCDNLTVLGRIPFKGQKINEFETTLDTQLGQNIKVESNLENVKIYYSENEQATADLTNEENKWTEEFQSLENVKSYMIKITDTVKQADFMNIKYNIKIPANLEHNAYIYDTATVYFENNRETGKINEEATSDIMCLTTGRGPQMEITQNATIPNGAYANEGQKIRYEIKVKNTGIDPIYNLEIKDILPENAIYTVYTRNGLSQGYDEKNPNAQILMWKLEKLDIGEETKVEFYVEVNKLSGTEETEYMINNASVNADDLEKEIFAEEYKNIVKSPEILVTEIPTVAEEVLLRENSDLTYNIRIQNNKNEDINGIALTKTLPEGLDYKDAYTIKYNPEYEEWEKVLTGTYNNENRKITLDLGTIAKDEDVQIKIETVTSKLQENEYSRKIETFLKITGNNISDYTGDVQRNTIAKPKLETETLCDNNNKYLNDGETVTYTLKATNVSNISANNVSISDVLPDNLELVESYYEIGNFKVTTSMDNNRKIEAISNLQPNETMVLTIKAKAVSKSQNIKVKNTAEIGSSELGVSQDKTVTHIVEAVQTKGSVPIETETRKYSISGKVWYDKNRDGTREENDENIANSEILVINADTGYPVKTATSDNDGNYYINDLDQGNYLVICKYDENKYQVTEYKKGGVSNTNNSDVISTEVQDNGKVYIAAISDTIRIENSDFENIDIGLTDKLIFDLKLESGIEKITLQNNKEIREHQYNDANLAKFDIAPEVLDGSKIYVEYKIKVTNEGNIAGYAKNIVDYMPKGMQFISELNPSWYIAQNGNIYSNELANTAINPGETKEIKLILLKNMTEENTGINVNTVEIYETYNEYGLSDIDSKENNQSDTEDDYSQTTTLIAVQAGGKILNTAWIFVVLVILLLVLYNGRKNGVIVLKKNKRKYK